jgi:NitT/TauT family transport system permease protein
VSTWPFVATALAVAAIYFSRRAGGIGSRLLLLLGLDAILLSAGQVIRELDPLVTLLPFVVASFAVAVIFVAGSFRGWTPRILLPLAVAVIFVCAWQFSCELTSYMNKQRDGSLRLIEIFPKPGTILPEMRAPIFDGELLRYTVASLFRIACGFGLAAAMGIPLGLWMGWSSRASMALNPLMQALRPISPLAWIPLAILWFGVKDKAAIFLITLCCFFPIVTGSMTAVRAIPLVYVRSAQNFGLEGFELFRRVVFPACLPQIITSLRLALGIGWIVIVAAEMIAVDSGLGYLIMDSRNASNYERVIGGMIAIGLIGVALDFGVRQLEKFDEVRWGFPNERKGSDDWRFDAEMAKERAKHHLLQLR